MCFEASAKVSCSSLSLVRRQAETAARCAAQASCAALVNRGGRFRQAQRHQTWRRPRECAKEGAVTKPTISACLTCAVVRVNRVGEKSTTYFKVYIEDTTSCAGSSAHLHYGFGQSTSGAGSLHRRSQIITVLVRKTTRLYGVWILRCAHKDST